MFEIDAMGKACPLPVILTKKALKEHDAVLTHVDNEIATQNLKKLAEQLQYSYQMEEISKTDYKVTVSKELIEVRPIVEERPTPVLADDSYIVVINTNTMGQGSVELGENLLKTFIYSLTEQDKLPEHVIFYNGGVHLVIEGADTIEDLKKMEESGVNIAACGACLNYYNEADQVAVGEITNMYRIVEIMRTANRIVRP